MMGGGDASSSPGMVAAQLGPGSKVSLISKSEIRYEGILSSFNLLEATISMEKVRSFGTEGRPAIHPVPPKDEVHEFIIFRGLDIKKIDVMGPSTPTPSGKGTSGAAGEGVVKWGPSC